MEKTETTLQPLHDVIAKLFTAENDAINAQTALGENETMLEKAREAAKESRSLLKQSETTLRGLSKETWNLGKETAKENDSLSHLCFKNGKLKKRDFAAYCVEIGFDLKANIHKKFADINKKKPEDRTPEESKLVTKTGSLSKCFAEFDTQTSSRTSTPETVTPPSNSNGEAETSGEPVKTAKIDNTEESCSYYVNIGGMMLATYLNPAMELAIEAGEISLENPANENAKAFFAVLAKVSQSLKTKSINLRDGKIQLAEDDATFDCVSAISDSIDTPPQLADDLESFTENEVRELVNA